MFVIKFGNELINVNVTYLHTWGSIQSNVNITLFSGTEETTFHPWNSCPCGLWISTVLEVTGGTRDTYRPKGLYNHNTYFLPPVVHQEGKVVKPHNGKSDTSSLSLPPSRLTSTPLPLFFHPTRKPNERTLPFTPRWESRNPSTFTSKMIPLSGSWNKRGGPIPVPGGPLIPSSVPRSLSGRSVDVVQGRTINPWTLRRLSFCSHLPLLPTS